MMPSLAVDISLLRFVQELFVRFPPSVTSLSESIEAFLLGQGYKLNVKVCPRVLLHLLQILQTIIT